ncbi:unnamed protein product [Ilex paraguariensis]|uniref:CASP-like protein n=1 Tax=Ilex paraguariensis TaxID=185542 RepID=A0ABC8U3P1_9AQUA
MDGVLRSDVKVDVSTRRVRCYDLLLRILGLALTMVAAIVAGVNKETETIPVTLVDGMPPLRVPVTAKWQQMSSTVYFVTSNAIACAYSAISLVLLLATRNRKNNVALALLMLDLIMVALLFSANGAAAGIGIIALNGNSHVQWHKVCNVFPNYCRRGAASIVMSMLGSVVFLWLVVLAALDLHRKSR